MSTRTLPPEVARRALILGGRSWIGFRLSEALCAAGWEVVCTTSSAIPSEDVFSGALRFAHCNNTQSIEELIQLEKPSVVVNLLIGIGERDFFVHQQAALAAEQTHAFYVYASSALALDGYQGEALLESLSPNSISEYGQFKQRCELDLQQRCGLAWLILRFASIHGWSPWKDTRTVALLKKMRAGEIIKVNRGVVQNRCSDISLAETIVSLIQRRASGVAHIGASDSSEEIDFLKRLAMAFGYSAEGIVADTERRVNLTVVPELGLSPGGAVYELDTLNALLAMPQLAPYKAVTGIF